MRLDDLAGLWSLSPLSPLGGERPRALVSDIAETGVDGTPTLVLAADSARATEELRALSRAIRMSDGGRGLILVAEPQRTIGWVSELAMDLTRERLQVETTIRLDELVLQLAFIVNREAVEVVLIPALGPRSVIGDAGAAYIQLANQMFAERVHAAFEPMPSHEQDDMQTSISLAIADERARAGRDRRRLEAEFTDQFGQYAEDANAAEQELHRILGSRRHRLASLAAGSVRSPSRAWRSFRRGATQPALRPTVFRPAPPPARLPSPTRFGISGDRPVIGVVGSDVQHHRLRDHVDVVPVSPDSGTSLIEAGPRGLIIEASGLTAPAWAGAASGDEPGYLFALAEAVRECNALGIPTLFRWDIAPSSVPAARLIADRCAIQTNLDGSGVPFTVAMYDSLRRSDLPVLERTIASAGARVEVDGYTSLSIEARGCLQTWRDAEVLWNDGEVPSSIEVEMLARGTTVVSAARESALGAVDPATLGSGDGTAMILDERVALMRTERTRLIRELFLEYMPEREIDWLSVETGMRLGKEMPGLIVLGGKHDPAGAIRSQRAKPADTVVVNATKGLEVTDDCAVVGAGDLPAYLAGSTVRRWAILGDPSEPTASTAVLDTVIGVKPWEVGAVRQQPWGVSCSLDTVVGAALNEFRKQVT